MGGGDDQVLTDDEPDRIPSQPSQLDFLTSLAISICSFTKVFLLRKGGPVSPMTIEESSTLPSFCSGEVISAGTFLEFRLPGAVDHTSLPGAMRFLHGRSTTRVPATVNEDGKLIKFATDGRQAGDNSLVVERSS